MLLYAPLDGDHKVDGKSNARKTTLGLIQNSRHVSLAQICLTSLLTLEREMPHLNQSSEKIFQACFQKSTDFFFQNWIFFRKKFQNYHFENESKSPNFSVVIHQTNLELKKTGSKKVATREMSNANVKMVKMVILHGKNLVLGPSVVLHSRHPM